MSARGTASALACRRTGAVRTDAGGPSDIEVSRAVAALTGRAPATIVRRCSPYRSSHPLEELAVTLDEGRELRLALKRLGGGARDGRSRQRVIAQPRFLLDPLREAAVYEAVLAHAPDGPPAHLGSWPGPAGERWLLLEWVCDGRELYQLGDMSSWSAAARWLGAFHSALAPGVCDHTARGRLLVYDAAYYRRWLDRATRFALARGGNSTAARLMQRLARHHDTVVETLLGLAPTVVHGDFNAANVLAEPDGAGGTRVAALDWELAAAGPGVVDLATLVSGDWSAAEREQLVAAYTGAGAPPFTMRELACARLHVALRWLGWAPPGWRPPPGQRHDWLADAAAMAEELGL